MNAAHRTGSYHKQERRGRLSIVAPVIAFDLALAHGRLVGVRLPDGDADLEELARTTLQPRERALADGLAKVRRRTWIGGRVAMRQALIRAGIDAPAVLSDPRGAPLLPPGVAGSITHKTALAAALVAREAFARVGVDLEDDRVGSIDISSRVLTDDEADEMVGLDAQARAREVLLRFSAKEALYKALDPFVKRYVGFKEVRVATDAEGGASVTLRLTQGEGPFAAEVHWLRRDGVVLTTARVAQRNHE